MPKYSMTLNQKVHRNHAIFQDYISGRSIIKISRKYGLTYDRTRTIIKEHSMRQYFVVDHADDIVLYRGSLEQCETVLQESYGGLMIVGYRDLTPGMIKSLDLLIPNKTPRHER
jgi:hypothetical protein